MFPGGEGKKSGIIPPRLSVSWEAFGGVVISKPAEKTCMVKYSMEKLVYITAINILIYDFCFTNCEQEHK